MNKLSSQREVIGIIAASGGMPSDVANALIAQGKDVFIIVLKDVATADLSAFDNITIYSGQLEKAIQAFKTRGCLQVVLAGKMIRPPSLSIKPDLRAVKILTKILSSGDDTALKIIKAEFAKDKIEILGMGEVMPQLYVNEGLICGDLPNKDVQAAINLGIDVLNAVGSFDLGQGCVAQASRVLALEGAEGTDAMLMRSSDLIRGDVSDAVFIKMLKSDQNSSLDPPGFGVETVRNADAAGIKFIALQANAVIMIDKTATIAEAEERGISIIGFLLD